MLLIWYDDILITVTLIKSSFQTETVTEFRFVNWKAFDTDRVNIQIMYILLSSIKNSKKAQRKKKIFSPRYGIWKKKKKPKMVKAETKNILKYNSFFKTFRYFSYFIMLQTCTAKKEIKSIISLILMGTNPVFLWKLKTGPPNKLPQYLNEA